MGTLAAMVNAEQLEDLSTQQLRELDSGLIAQITGHDQQIAERLKDLGMEIARRTVAKYRDQLRILPARSRRRYDASRRPGDRSAGESGLSDITDG